MTGGVASPVFAFWRDGWPATVSSPWKIRLSKPAYRGGSSHRRPTSWSFTFAAHIYCPYLAHAARPCGLYASTVGRRDDARISAL
jgi:hypothetical protein